MKLMGIMPVRNEAHELGLTLRAALQWCDEMVVWLHACTDDSKRIAHEVTKETGRVRELWCEKPEWDEMEHRQKMLTHARAMGATHIAMIDADEILTGNLLATEPKAIHAAIAGLLPGHCLQLPMYQLRGSLDRYHSNGIWGNRWLSVAFADDPKLSWSGDKFHSREPLYPDGSKLKPYQPIKHGEGGVFHLWGVSARRLRAKHALYKITERLRWPERSIHKINQMYNLWRTPHDCRVEYPEMPEYHKEWTFATTPAIWWQPYAEILHHLTWEPDAEPWQEAEVRRLVREHGIAKFQHLDLFGVA